MSKYLKNFGVGLGLSPYKETEDDENAVTNKYGKVHGIEGLRVVDCSIMPDCVRANTNATAIMMGEKISDHIKLGD